MSEALTGAARAHPGVDIVGSTQEPPAVTTPRYQELLGWLGRGGAVACPCGLTHHIAVREVILGERALEASRELLLRLHGPRPSLWVLSDERTEAAAGARWKSLASGGRVASTVLPADPRPVPTMELVVELGSTVRELAPELLVGVGSGVVSDLVKRVSLDTGVPNWCVATAPSVDAYSSATSAIRVGGHHLAVPSRPSDVIVCDLDVMREAPPQMFLAGLGDLLGKFLAHLDWNLSRMITREHLCEPLASLALGSARLALAAAREQARDPRAAVRSLTDAILVSGFAMQALGSSRPAASAEHTVAHFWETAGAVGNATLDLHGILVGAASNLVLRSYSAFYGKLDRSGPDAARRLEAYRRERPWREALPAEMRPFEDKIASEQRGRAFDGAELARRLEAFAARRGGISELAGAMLAELSGAVDLLAGLGFPFSLDVLGIADGKRYLPLRQVRLLRNRYTTFDLAYELGREDDLLEPFAAPAGRR